MIVGIARVGALLIEQWDSDKVEITIIDEYKGRILKTSLWGKDVEGLCAILGKALIAYYESEIKRVESCLKEARKCYEEETKEKRPSQEILNRYLQSIKANEESLNKLEKKKEAMKKLLEVLLFEGA